MHSWTVRLGQIPCQKRCPVRSGFYFVFSAWAPIPKKYSTGRSTIRSYSPLVTRRSTIEQCKLTSSVNHITDGEGQTQAKPRAGVRQLQIPLRGMYARGYGMSTLNYVKHVYADLGVWRKYVPFGVDSLHRLEFFE